MRLFLIKSVLFLLCIVSTQCSNTTNPSCLKKCDSKAQVCTLKKFGTVNAIALPQPVSFGPNVSSIPLFFSELEPNDTYKQQYDTFLKQEFDFRNYFNAEVNSTLTAKINSATDIDLLYIVNINFSFWITFKVLNGSTNCNMYAQYKDNPDGHKIVPDSSGPTIYMKYLSDLKSPYFSNREANKNIGAYEIFCSGASGSTYSLESKLFSENSQNLYNYLAVDQGKQCIFGRQECRKGCDQYK